MVDGINSNYSGSNYTTDTSGSVLGKDDFMKLMIAQLKYQDPLNPMEGTEFSSQLAQFSQLEQLQNLNDNFAESINANYYLTQSISNTMAATLIGKEVKISGNEFTCSGQENVALGFNLAKAPADVKINIYNEAGTLVRTITGGNYQSGDNKLSFDLSDNYGNKLPNGKYTFEVEATDSDNAEIEASTYMFGLIGGIKYTENGTVMLVNGSEYNLSDIIEILNPSTTDKEDTEGALTWLK